MKFFVTLFIFTLVLCHNIFAQFPGAAGTSGSTAIFKDSSIFVAWANSCTVWRGFQDISDTSLGYANTGDASFALGQADGIQVVSLGDAGYAFVEFVKPIKNGPGFDFAVFENGFIDEFLELAFVEVSSDGVNYFRFKATSNTQTDVQVGPFDYNADPTLMNNLAGKYRAMYGTPFDLEEMTGIQGLNVDSITHIKVIDVVGSINPLYGSYDQNNNIINEHFPTPFPQGGFDLDAIGVIHQQVAGYHNNHSSKINISPNPFNNLIKLNTDINLIERVEISDQLGTIVFSKSNFKDDYLDLIEFKLGIYYLKIVEKNGSIRSTKILKI